MSAPNAFLVIDDLSGGFHSGRSPLDLLDTELTQAENVEWFNSRMPQKRRGTTAYSLSSWSPTNCNITSLVKHTPTAGVTSNELWAFTNKATTSIGRMAGGTTFASITPSPDDGPNGSIGAMPELVFGASFNNKLFLTFPNTVQRTHVWDGTTLRRTGMAVCAAPSVANDPGAGAYAAIVRYYKVSFIELSGSVVVRRGELSTATTFTPSGAGTAARITKPTNPGEGETHWEVWASPNNVNFFKLATTAIGTTTYDDSADTTTYANNTAAPASGAYTNMVGAKYVTVADNRVFLAGAWNPVAADAAAFASRVWFTPIFGTTAEGDDERIPTANYLDIDVTAHGPIVGFGLLFDAVLVFKQTACYKLVRTGDATVPYTVVQISDRLGAIGQRTIVSGEDATGQPCVFWASPQGIHQWSPSGLVTISDKILTFWRGLTIQGSEHGFYWAERRQVWFFVTRTISSQIPNAVLVYHVPQGCWSLYTNGASATNGIGRSNASVVFAQTPGATMSFAEIPWIAAWIGGGSPTPVLQQGHTGTQDNGVSFQAQITTKAFPVQAPMTNGDVYEAQVIANALDSKTLQLTITRDFGVETRSTTASLTSAVGETRVIRKFEDARMVQGQVAQFTIGDASAVASDVWELDALILRTNREQVR